MTCFPKIGSESTYECPCMTKGGLMSKNVRDVIMMSLRGHFIKKFYNDLSEAKLRLFSCVIIKVESTASRFTIHFFPLQILAVLSCFICDLFFSCGR